MKTKLLFVVALLALGAGLLWMRLRSSERNAAGGMEITRPTLAGEPADRVKSMALPTPAASEAPGESPAAAGEGERATVAAEKVDFAVKYAGWSLERLEGTKAVLNKSYVDQCNAVLDERFKAGLFEELIVKEGESAPAMELPGKVWGGGEPPGPGLMRYKITKLPLEEYPQLKSLGEEVGWLMTQTHALSPGQK